MKVPSQNVLMPSRVRLLRVIAMSVEIGKAIFSLTGITSMKDAERRHYLRGNWPPLLARV
jgi:hypothetical protein